LAISQNSLAALAAVYKTSGTQAREPSDGSVAIVMHTVPSPTTELLKELLANLTADFEVLIIHARDLSILSSDKSFNKNESIINLNIMENAAAIITDTVPTSIIINTISIAQLLFDEWLAISHDLILELAAACKTAIATAGGVSIFTRDGPSSYRNDLGLKKPFLFDASECWY
jgi:hypothetical protein